MTMDIYGPVIDDWTVETALIDTMKAWIDSHLAIQEQRHSKTLGSMARPNSWPAVSQFDLQLQDQLPAIIVEYAGTVSGETAREIYGGYRQAFIYNVTVAIAGADERDCRELASMYLAAIKSALVQNRTLGGLAETTVLVGPDRPSVGSALGSTTAADRAIYGTTFHVFVRDTVNDRLGPDTPPVDPYTPGDLPPWPDTAEITVEADLEDS